MAIAPIQTLGALPRIFLLISLSAVGIFSLVTACGQDTPITVDNVTHANWPESITGTPFTSGVTPNLAGAMGSPTTPRAILLMTPQAGANSPQTATAIPANIALPACAPAMVKSLALPSTFAPNFPFPPGLGLTKSSTLENNPNYVLLVGYVPLTLKDSVRFMLDGLPKAGYELGRGDSEPGEAEATFSGNGWRGGFRIADINDCLEVTEWVIVVVKQ